MQHYPHARRIWLTRRYWKILIHMAAIEILISIPILAKPVFAEHFIKYAENEVAVGELAPLTKKGSEELLCTFIKVDESDRQ